MVPGQWGKVGGNHGGMVGRGPEGERAASAKIRESFEITHVFLDPGCHIFKAISRSSIKGRKIGLCVLASIATFTRMIPGTVVSYTN